MKIMNKLKVVIMMIFLMLLVSSCSYLEKPEAIEEENIVKEEVKIEEIEKVSFNTIESTFVRLDEIGSRLIGTEGNNSFSREIKTYLNDNFKDAELFLQPYTISLTDEYNVIVKSGSQQIVFSNTDSICKYINKGKLTETAKITNTLDNLDKSISYIFITDDIKKQDISKEYSNICLSLLVVDEIFLGQNVIKVKPDIPTIMNINKETAENLLNIKDTAEMTIDIKNKEIELENIIAVIKGKSSNNAIVVTSHMDTTTALGNNYSKGAIDNGSGNSLNLDLLRKVYEAGNTSNYDIVFALVNSEEGFLTRSSSGSMQLNDMLAQKYENILNINLDCLGEKNIDKLSYGFDGNVNSDMINYIITSQEIEGFNLEKAEYYTSDNLSFENSIYFYNFDYHGENRAIHTERDTFDMVDFNSLEKISVFVYNILSELIKLDGEALFK